MNTQTKSLLTVELAAFHESGHLVTARLLGNVVQCSMDIGGDSFACMRHTVPLAEFFDVPLTYISFCDVVVSAGGKAAQEEYERRNRLPAYQHGWSRDIEHMQQHARSMLTQVAGGDVFKATFDLAAYFAGRAAVATEKYGPLSKFRENIERAGNEFLKGIVSQEHVDTVCNGAHTLAAELVQANWESVQTFAKFLISWKGMTEDVLPTAPRRIIDRFDALGGFPEALKPCSRWHGADREAL